MSKLFDSALVGNAQQALFDNTLNAILLVNDEGRYVEANPAACALTHYSREELRRLSVWDLTPALARLRTSDLWQTFIAAGSQSGEYTLLRRDGTSVEVEFLVVANIVPDLHLALLRDITERKRAEETLRQSEERYRSLVEASPDAIILTDLNPNITMINQQGIILFGYEHAAEMIGRSAFDFIVPEEWPRAVADIQKILETGGIRNVEYTLFKGDGARFSAEVSASLIRDAPGNPKAFTAVLRNISKRKQAEETLQTGLEQAKIAYKQALIYARELKTEIVERRRTQEALQRREQEYRSLAENAPDIIVRFDRQLRHLYINHRIETKTGLPPSAFLGPTNREMGMPAQVVDYWDEKLNQVFETGQAATLEFEFSTPAGLGYFEARIIPEAGPDGSIETVLVISRDITERKRVEEERARYAVQLQGLAGVSLLINSSLPLSDVLKIVTEKAREIIGTHVAIISFTVDESWTQDIQHVSLSDKYAAWSGYDENPDGSGIYALVCQTGRPVRLTQPELEAHPAWRGWLAAPLIGPNDQNIGLIQLFDKYEGEFSQNDEAILVQLAQMVSGAIENARLFEQIHSAHERLQALSRRLLEVQEAERRHIARELHDEVGQVLTGLNLLLGMNARLSTTEARANLAEAQTLVNELMQQVDKLSLDLRPPMLDDLGLLPALLWQFERYTQQTHVQVAFKHAGLDKQRFASEVETAAYRLVQEALTNVARHAGVGEVLVRLWANQDVLNLQVEDHGLGFEPQSTLLEVASRGLSGMRERVGLLGGQMMIESSPGAGVSLIAELPLHCEPK